MSDKTNMCCGGGEVAPSSTTHGPVDAPWTDGLVRTSAGEFPRVKASLSARDHLGTATVRCGIARMSHTVPAGLYALGDPDAEAPVFVSANYKMSFDRLRAALVGRNAWILVLDTRGINVWCAAGKGTFGTDEIVRRVELSGLGQVVSHRKLVVPQLAAPGVSAHEVRSRCGFHVIYGPVRALDLPAFLDARMTATSDMRRVRFDVLDRVVLIPIELVMGMKKALLTAAAFVLLGGLGTDGYSMAGVRTSGLPGAAFVLGAFLGGAILGPVLLPCLPGRAFSVKGAALGVVLVLALLLGAWPVLFGSWLHSAAWGLMIPAITSFVVMNFTGATTFTSLSGVLREMRFALPIQISAGVVGLVLWLVGLFVRGGS